MSDRVRVRSGIAELDRLLGGLFVGDNVVWHDEAGSLAAAFCLNFLRASEEDGRPLIYVSFDRSPNNLFDMLGDLANSPALTILDCFTWGKGAGSEIFSRYYYESSDSAPCRVIPVHDPSKPAQVMDAFYGLHSTFEGDVHFIFESLTGMEELWGSEEELANFYAHSCPRLYELRTVAYWMIEKKAHSQRTKAQINQVAQVVIDLSIKRGTSSLTVIKAENRDRERQQTPVNYWTKGQTVTFEREGKAAGPHGIGSQLKHLRTQKGLSQAELSRLVGVTPSTISQVEGDLIHPSLPALLKIAEVLNVEIGDLFQSMKNGTERVVFPAAQALPVRPTHLTSQSVEIKSLLPAHLTAKAEPYLIEIASGKSISSHFFVHKGEEIGYLVAGQLDVTMNQDVLKMRTGDTIHLTRDVPTVWKNAGRATARLLWLNVS